MNHSHKKNHDLACTYCGKEHDLKEIEVLLGGKSNVSVPCDECRLKTNFRKTRYGYIRAYHSVQLPIYFTSVHIRRNTFTATQVMLIKEAFKRIYDK